MDARVESTQRVIELESDFAAPNYAPLPVVLDREQLVPVREPLHLRPEERRLPVKGRGNVAQAAGLEYRDRFLRLPQRLENERHAGLELRRLVPGFHLDLLLQFRIGNSRPLVPRQVFPEEQVPVQLLDPVTGRDALPGGPFAFPGQPPLTDGAGRLVFEHVTPGSYMLAVPASSGVVVSPTPVAVREGETAAVTLTGGG